MRHALIRFLCLGTEQDFCKILQGYCERYLGQNFQIESSHPGQRSIIDLVTKTSPCIVYLDLTGLAKKEKVLEEILFLKRYKSFKSTLFAAILSDTSNKTDQSLLYSSGFHLCYVKGGEIETFIADSFYIGLGEKVPMPEFAKAKNINQDLEVGICSTISKMSPEEFFVETDFDQGVDKLSIKLPMFKELSANSFKIKSHNKSPLLYPMVDSFVLEYPYVGPWDDVTSETIQRETVETWLELKDGEFVKKDCFIKVISKNIEICHPLFETTLKSPFIVEFIEEIDFENIHNELTLKKAPLIFYDLEKDENSTNGPDSLAKLISIIRGINVTRPIIVVLNSPSSTNALQKAYEYKNLISTPNRLSIDLFQLLIRSFVEKGQIHEQAGGNDCYLGISDTQRAIDVIHNVYVTGLTEHEITFYSKVELPMFAVLHLTLPVDCFVTIVPPYFQLETSSYGNHYLGFIHGLSEEEMKHLRKFVNQIIYRPLEKFTPEVVSALLKQKDMEIIVEKNNENAEKPVNESAELLSKKTVGDKTFTRPPVRGKSKL